MSRSHRAPSGRHSTRPAREGRAPLDLAVLVAFAVGLIAGVVVIAFVVRADLLALVGVVLGLARLTQGMF